MRPKRLASILIATAAVVAVPATPAQAATYGESFEKGFGGWAPDTDGLAPAWGVTRSGDQAYHGKYSLKIYMDGRLDDGTTWVERRFTVAPSAKVEVTLTFQLWSGTQAGQGAWAVVATASDHDPEVESDFAAIGNTEAAVGWTAYGKSWTVTADNSGTVWVAFGTSVLWEVEKSHYLDYTRVIVHTDKGTYTSVS